MEERLAGHIDADGAGVVAGNGSGERGAGPDGDDDRAEDGDGPTEGADADRCLLSLGSGRGHAAAIRASVSQKVSERSMACWTTAVWGPVFQMARPRQRRPSTAASVVVRPSRR